MVIPEDEVAVGWDGGDGAPGFYTPPNLGFWHVLSEVELVSSGISGRVTDIGGDL